MLNSVKSIFDSPLESRITAASSSKIKEPNYHLIMEIIDYLNYRRNREECREAVTHLKQRIIRKKSVLLTLTLAEAFVNNGPTTHFHMRHA